jgi:hypothetical protein
MSRLCLVKLKHKSKMSLIPPKEALAISRTGKSALFEKFKFTFTQLYNSKVQAPGFRFPMHIHRFEIRNLNPALANSLSALQMETMIKTILTECDNDPSIKVTVSHTFDQKDDDEWVTIDVQEVEGRL